MTALSLTSRNVLALFAAMALMLIVVLATFTAAFSATGSNRAASTWHHTVAASTWHHTVAASTWNKVSTVASPDASTWH